MKIGRITLSDNGDRWGEEIERLVGILFEEPSEFVREVVINSDQARAALTRFCDEEKCPLVVTTGGTGPRAADFMPDVTTERSDRVLPGFGDIMRQYSYEKTPLAILSRAVAGVRGHTLIVNLPARPKAIGACLKMLREPMAECIEQVTGVRPVLYVNPVVIPVEKWFPFLKRLRPKTPTAR